ncbi:hypothetical protein GQ457_15G026970 [Hibiscus cannabinus]
MISGRSSLPASGPEAQRHASAIRRKITILGTRLDGLQSLLSRPVGKPLTETEMNRRKDMIANLRSKANQMASTCKVACSETRHRKLLVGNAIVQVDAAPFKQWYLQHYGVDIGRKKKTAAVAKKEGEEGETGTEETKKSNHVLRKIEKRQQNRKLEPHIEDQFASGRLLACITSRPGQCGRCDGVILEGKELEFYMKKIQRKKGKGAA